MSCESPEAFTAEDVKNYEDAFRRMPSYKEDGFIKSDDIPILAKEVKYKVCTEKELKSFKTYWDKRYGGIIPLSKALEMVEIMHDSGNMAKKLATTFDADKSGFISEDEFKEIMEFMIAHDSRLKDTTFEAFVASADLNRDGKVSIDECAAWIDNCCKVGSLTPSNPL